MRVAGINARRCGSRVHLEHVVVNADLPVNARPVAKDSSHAIAEVVSRNLHVVVIVRIDRDPGMHVERVIVIHAEMPPSSRPKRRARRMICDDAMANKPGHQPARLIENRNRGQVTDGPDVLAAIDLDPITPIRAPVVIHPAGKPLAGVGPSADRAHIADPRALGRDHPRIQGIAAKVFLKRRLIRSITIDREIPHLEVVKKPFEIEPKHHAPFPTGRHPGQRAGTQLQSRSIFAEPADPPAFFRPNSIGQERARAEMNASARRERRQQGIEPGRSAPVEWIRFVSCSAPSIRAESNPNVCASCSKYELGNENREANR